MSQIWDSITGIFKKKDGPKVYDFLFSIDFGLCHGEIDSLNQVWVKDRKIWCGVCESRNTYWIENVDLFGGDDGEGGVKGYMEVYTGTDSQKMSAKLAGKYGRTPDTAPGYRGLAHVLFTGKGDRGWVWTTNNPYLPATAFHITRRPRGLPETTAMIYPFDHYDGSGNPVQVDPFLTAIPEIIDAQSLPDPVNVISNFTIDLPSYGYTDNMIDNGNLAVSIDGGGDAHFIGLAGTGPAGGVMTTTVTFRDANGTAIQSGVPAGGVTGSGVMSFDGPEVLIPATTRTIDVHTNYVLTLPFFSRWGDTWFDSNIHVQGTEGTGTAEPSDWHCQIYDELDPDAEEEPENEGLALMPNANPAHIIYECMVNEDWGKGEDPANIDYASFVDAATTLYGELFGLSFMWVRQDTIESFIENVLSHINAMLFIAPASGLWTLKLLRDDYDAGAARVVDEYNCVAKNRKRRGWGETINEIVVEYTDPISEDGATVAAHNMANVAVQGGVNSETRSYRGIRDKWLANIVAKRDVQESGYPLYSATLEVDRTFWDVSPGDVLKLSWAEDGIANMIVRVFQVDYGSRKDRTIKLEVSEDVFALAQTSYVETQTSEWYDGRQTPSPLDAQFGMGIMAPLITGAGVALADLDAEYPATGVLFWGDHNYKRVLDIALYTEVTDKTGATSIGSVKSVLPTESLVLDIALAEEATSVIHEDYIDQVRYEPRPGDFLVLGSSEDLHEIVMLYSYNAGTLEWTVARGIYDTIPRAWPIGTRLWDFQIGTNAEGVERTVGETRTWRLLPRMSEGRLDYADATDLTLTLSDRPYLPFRPADTELDGNGFALLDYSASATPVSSITATWANRHRGMEDSLVQKWEDSNITPEAGQTVTLEVYDDTDTLQNTITGLTGTSHVLNYPADLGGVNYGYVRFLSERDGFTSLMGADRWFDLRNSGYGVNYGQNYG